MPADRVTADAAEFYILAPEVPVPERNYVLKQDETFALINEFGDIAIGARHEEGLYHDGTRYLSLLALKIAGGRPLLLSAGLGRDNLELGVDLTNPDIYLAGNLILPRGSLHIFRSKLLFEGACHERIHLRNFTLQALDIALVVEFAADYRDIFEIRGQRRTSRGKLLEPRCGVDFVELGYLGLDGVRRCTTIRCEPAPSLVNGREMRLSAHLEARSEQVFCLSMTCSSQSQGPHPTALSYDAARASAERCMQDPGRLGCEIRATDDRLNAWLDRSATDLNMLLTRTSCGLYPYAGVPWFDTVFGRDGLITALECLWLAPNIARGVLAYLAHTQSTEDDPQSDAEPGKILHERRGGEMAALGEVPFARYYGSVDATPLFVLLAGAYWRRTNDLAFVEGIWRNVRAALTWCEKYGDRDGDGFVEYQCRSRHGLVQQGWKDSQDSVFHADGRMAQAPIALCEVQGYVYAARCAGAELATALGLADYARELEESARKLKDAFQARFWCEELGVYALALDGEKQPCRVRSSNSGHCLFTGIASPRHAASIASVLSQDTFFSGWGVRTLADREQRYNPMAYHNGSIWPHDNALIAAGLTALPQKDLALRILCAQLEASTYFESSRLPELFCGFRRREGKAPTRYPVACSPQAWSAAAVFGMLKACLGLRIDARVPEIAFRYPRLPPHIERLSIRGLCVGQARVDVTLHRYSGAVGLNVEHRQGELDVSLLS